MGLVKKGVLPPTFLNRYVLNKISMYKKVSVYQITKQLYSKAFRRKRNIVEARWIWWYYLRNKGYTYTEISKMEKVDHETVYHAFNNDHLILNDEVNQIIKV